ncbi:DHH family phosphoesterase [Ferroacidibacillus organovorans]|uniref:DHHA1 domain-containing protein n=1 Tax=Ferroacidibacillus organovorans TaxID=1765683 RepID=A0A117SY62_9BACL|nr:DHHA1 domain-containing protein [Ferroacidibacillus organovorans]KUO96438.1 hypothetical protein ATW55_00940 [Ferroacidibacillus organovorans]
MTVYQDYENVKSQLLSERQFVLVTHRRGDADSACVFALAEALQILDKRVEVLHDVPGYLDWLFAPYRQQTVDNSQPVCFVALDTGNYARLALPKEIRESVGEMIRAAGREDQVDQGALHALLPFDLVIDHHASNPGYGRYNWIDPKASSTSELLTMLLLDLERETGKSLFTEAICQSLFAGIVSDTQWFLRDTTARTYEMAGVIEQRATLDKPDIAANLMQRSPAYFGLGSVLRKNVRRTEALAWSFLDRASIRAYGAEPEEAALLIEELEKVPCKIAVLFIEEESGVIRVRLRGKGVPILELAKRHGGGGHLRRAGVMLKSRQEVARFVEDAAKESMRA